MQPDGRDPATVRGGGVIYGSVCSGIEAATEAWHPLGWRPAFFSEIDRFARSYLTEHYPDVPLHGDFTTIGEKDYGAIDLLVGGTPCQSFSIAGLRKGMADDRGNLALEFCRLLDRKKPRWFVWENVPGVLSSNGGRDFGAFLGGVAECGYGFAYRVLDAQYFGLAQRRERVFVVGYSGDWRPAAAVFFEQSCLRGNPAPSRKAGQGFAAHAENRSRTGDRAHQGLREDDEPRTARLVSFGEYTMDERASTMRARDHKDSTDLVIQHIDGGEVARTLKASHDGSPTLDGSGYDVIAFSCKDYGNGAATNISPTLRAMNAVDGNPNGGGQMAVAIREVAGTMMAQKDSGGFSNSADAAAAGYMAVVYENHMQDSRVKEVKVSPTLNAKAGTGGGNLPLVQQKMNVRRLTPRECERLQGFPDDKTLIPKSSDSARYKALGNSMAVPVMRWIGERIQKVEEVLACRAS